MFHHTPYYPNSGTYGVDEPPVKVRTGLFSNEHGWHYFNVAWDGRDVRDDELARTDISFWFGSPEWRDNTVYDHSRFISGYMMQWHPHRNLRGAIKSQGTYLHLGSAPNRAHEFGDFTGRFYSYGTFGKRMSPDFARATHYLT